MEQGMPRSTIPAAWAKQGCCPFCQAAKLSVRQTPDAPDQLVCAQCGCAFELEAAGTRLALTEGPPAVAATIGGATRVWLYTAEVRAMLPRSPAGGPSAPRPPDRAAAPERPAAANQTPVPLLPQTQTAAATETVDGLPSGLAACTKAELLQRAESLLALGNSPLQIQVALVQSGVAPALVEVVMGTVHRLAHEKRQRQVRQAWLWTGLLIVCIVLAIGVAIGLWYKARPSPGSAGETPGVPTPTGVAGFLLSLPTAVVQTQPPPAIGGVSPAGRCPGTSGEAANVFGGKAADWTYKPDAGGWIMTAITPQTISIPAGMIAGYLQFGQSGAAVTQVNGPAKIQNVNFIAITCS